MKTKVKTRKLTTKTHSPKHLPQFRRGPERVRQAVEDLVDLLTVQYSFLICTVVHHIARKKEALSPASLISVMRSLSAAGPRLTNSDGLAPRLGSSHSLFWASSVSTMNRWFSRRKPQSPIHHRFIADLSPICHRFIIDFLDLSLPRSLPPRKTKLQSSGLAAAGVQLSCRSR